MAKEKKFNFGATKVARMSEDIRDNNVVTVEQSQPAITSTEQTVVEADAPANQHVPAPVLTENVNDEQPKPTVRRKSSTSLQASKAKKSKNGIVIDVPIDEYLELMRLKVMTGKTLKELALQAVHEFVERNK